MTGDLLLDRFGLAPSQYEHLAATVDTVMHVAITGTHAESYEGYYRGWVMQLLSTLSFCATGRIKHLTYMGSTIANVYAEPDDFTRTDSFWHCGYSRMKWVNHAILDSLSDSGLRLTLCQTPYLLASTRGGKDPGMRYAFWHAMRAARHYGALWRGPGPAFAPVDIACRAVVVNTLENEPLRDIRPLPPAPYGNDLLARLMGIELVEWADVHARLAELLTGSVAGVCPRDLPRLVQLSNLPARYSASFEIDDFPAPEEIMPQYLRAMGLLFEMPLAARG